MDILILTQYFWPEIFRINELAALLAKEGNRVTVLTGIPNYPAGRFASGYGWFRNTRQDYEGVRIIRVPLLPRLAGRSWQLALNYFSFALSASVFGPLVCRGHYDVIFVYEPSPITVGFASSVLRAIKKAPVAFWVQDLWPESIAATGAIRSDWALKAVRRMVRFIYRRCDLILAQSRAFVPEIRRLSPAGADIRYFPNSADTLYRPDSFPAESREARSLPREGFRVMFAGNIGAAQNFETILAAAEILRERKSIQWLILGDGRQRNWVAEQIAKRKLENQVHLLGMQPVDSMPKWFGLADALLVTLKREPIFALTIPAKIQSYLACGKPCLAAIDGEGAKIIEEAGAGLTCPAEDPEALARLVLRMSEMPASDREKMGASGLLYFRDNFEIRALLKRLQEWLRELSYKHS